MEIAALVPTLYRPDGLRRVLRSLADTAPEVWPVVAREADDATAEKIGRGYGAIMAVCEKPRAGCAYAWNTALKAAPDYDAYLIASDDAEFLPNWLKCARKGLDKGFGFIGLYAAWKRTWYSFFYLMTREFIIKHHGGVAAVPHYKVWGADTEACDRALAAGQYYKTPEQCVIHHRVGILPQSRRMITKQIYNRRKAQGFPDDYERILCE